MKKYLFMAIAAVAAFAMSSCNPNEPQKQDEITITLSEESLELGIDDTKRLTITVSPVGAQVQPKYASSNTNVATVSASGIVTAIAEGEAQIIVSAEGAIGDTCFVRVSNMAVYKNFELVDYGLFGDFEDIPGTETVVKLSGGEANVQLSYITLYAWDADLNYSKSGGWSGHGLLMGADVAVYRIIAGDATTASGYTNSIGYWVGSGQFSIADMKANGYQYYPYTAQSGKMNVNKFGDFVASYIAAETSEDIDWDAAEEAVSGAYLMELDCESAAEARRYWMFPYAVIDRMAIVENEDESVDMGYDITWGIFTTDDRLYGLKAILNEEGQATGVVTPYDYATYGPVHYGTLSFDEEQETKYHIGNMNKVHKEMPAFVKNKKTDRLYKK